MKVEFFFYITIYNNFMNWPIVPFLSQNLGYKFFIDITFMPLYNFMNGYKLLLLELETYCLMLNCISSCKGLFLYESFATMYDKKDISFFNYIQSYNSESYFLIHCKEEYV